jgi:ATP-dependent Zn protease
MLHDDIDKILKRGRWAPQPPQPPIEPKPFRCEMFDVVASVHEAAHCLWNYVHHEPVHTVEINKQGRGGGEFKATPDSGTVELSEDDDLETRVRQDGRILGAILDPATRAAWLKQLPGFVVSRHAQRRFGAKGEFYDRLCSHDDLIVERVINLMVADPAERRRLHDQVECEAREFVDRHWPEIEKLGNVLFERRRLDKHEIEAVLAAPKQSEPEFRRRQDGYISPAPCLDARTIGAYHESGHALVAVALNQKIKKLSVNSDGTGLCRVAQLPTTQNRKALLNYCAVASGGGIAASRLTGENRWGVQDHKNIENALAGLSTRDAVQVLQEARKLAERIISQNWGSVRSLAHELHRRGEMDGTEVASVLSGFRAAA